jgi:uncharacterized protein
VTGYFLDTSALVKRYVVENGTTWMRAITHLDREHVFHTAQITLVEIMAAINRRHREGSLSAQFRDDAAKLFQQHLRNQYNVVRLTMAVIKDAQSLTDKHPLRAYDAVQLASALRINRQTIADGAPAITFVCADTRLLAIAAAEGLATQDPAAS